MDHHFLEEGGWAKKNSCTAKTVEKNSCRGSGTEKQFQGNNFKEVLCGVIILIFDVKKILGQAFAQ